MWPSPNRTFSYTWRNYTRQTHRIRAKNALDTPIFAIFEVNPIWTLALVMGPKTAQLALVLWLICAGK